jgi:predicted DCC family thiol-disulfide oxidoreductase YuxK
VAWVRAREAQPFEYLPCQDPSRAERFPGITTAQCLESMWLVLPDGRRLAGEKALPEVLRRVRGWRSVAFLFDAPGIRHLSPLVYRWIARHRLQLSALVRTKAVADGGACGLDEDCDT